MEKNVLTITLDSKGADVDALSTVEVLHETLSLLREIEEVRLDGKAQHRWLISHATKSNPLEVSIGGALAHDRGTTLDPIADFLEGMTALAHGLRPEAFTDQMLGRAKKIARRVGSGLASVSYRDARSHVVSVSRKLGATAESLQLPSEYSELGELEGVLGQVTSYGDDHEFCIYDSLTGKKIHCDFSPDDFERVRAALKRRVRVSGKIKYKRDDDSPQRVSVDTWSALPEDKDLPSIEDLHAMKMDFTRGRPSEEVIAELRRVDA